MHPHPEGSGGISGGPAVQPTGTHSAIPSAGRVPGGHAAAAMARHPPPGSTSNPGAQVHPAAEGSTSQTPPPVVDELVAPGPPSTSWSPQPAISATATKIEAVREVTVAMVGHPPLDRNAGRATTA